MSGSDSRSSLGPGLSGLGLTLGLAAVACAWIVSNAVVDVRREGQSVEVKGYAEKRLVSDLGVWTGTFTTRGPELGEVSARLDEHAAAVLAFLADHQVPKAEIELLPVQTQVLFRRNPDGSETHLVEGYALSQPVRVTSREIDRIAQISLGATALTRQGIEFSSWPPEYLYTKLGDLKIEMLGAATADARERAQALASSSGSAIGRLRYARQGVFQITPAHSTEVSNYGQNDTTSREKTIKAVVTVGYALAD